MKSEIRFAIRYLKWKLSNNGIPYKLTLMPTRKCNNRCKTCSIWRENKENKIGRSETLTLDEYEKLAKSFGKNLLWLNITGGEPFLYENLSELLLTFIRHCPNLRMINIPTNGLLTERICEVLRSVLNNKITIHITLSLDGIGGVNDDIRGVNGAYDSVINSYSKLLELKNEFPILKISFQTTISKYNIDQLEKLTEFAFSKSDVYIVTFAQNAEFYNNLEFDLLDNVQILDSIRKLFASYKLKSLSHIIPKTFILLAYKFYEDKYSPLKRCSAGKATLSLSPVGDIYNCIYKYESIANIRDLGSDFELKQLKNIKGRKEKTKNCRECWNNCEAIPTMLDNNLLTARAMLESVWTMLKD